MSRTWMAVGLCLACVPTLAMGAIGGGKELRFGVFPSEGPKIMFERYTPLAQYLTKELGIPVTLVVGKNYQTSIDQLGKGEVQLALFSPSLYPRCEGQYPDAGIKPIVRFRTGASGIYAGHIVVRADSGIRSVAELRGKRMAAATEESMTGNLAGRLMLLEAGIDPNKDLARYEYVGTQLNEATGLKNGAFDAIIVKTLVADRCVQEGFGRIIATSKDIPTEPICINNKLDPEIAQKIKAALLKLDAKNESDKAVLAAMDPKYTGCEEAKASDYDYAREVIKKLYGGEFYKKK